MSEVIALNVATSRRLVAIAFLDVAGYSRLMGVQEEATLAMFTQLRTRAIEPRVRYWRGRIANRAGDGMLMEFASALDATHWAIDLQRLLMGAGAEEYGGLKVRIALHLTDVIDYDGDDLMGDGVNVAARLQQLSEPGGIIATQALVDAVAGKVSSRFVDIGPRRLKHIARPVHSYRLELKSGAGRWPVRAAVLAAATVAVSVGVAALTLTPGLKKRDMAQRLVDQAGALVCAASPCAGVWLQQRHLLEQAIALDPTNARAYALAAITYTNMVSTNSTADAAADKQEAARLATRAVALAPDQAFSFAARAAVLRQNPEKVEMALSDYIRSLDLDPSQVKVRANIGWMLILLGRAGEAIPYLDGALAAAPDNAFAPAWLSYRGLADVFLDAPGHGAAYFRKALAQEPATPSHWQHRMERTIALASAEALNGHVGEARQLISALLAVHPTVSVHNILWNCDCSKNPGFLSGMARLRDGALLAGVPGATERLADNP